MRDKNLRKYLFKVSYDPIMCVYIIQILATKKYSKDTNIFFLNIGIKKQRNFLFL